MNKKPLIILLIIAVFTAVAVFTSYMLIRKDDGKTVVMDLYYLNNTASSIVAEQEEIKFIHDDELADAVIKKLIKGPSNSKNTRIMNSNTQLLSLIGDGNGGLTVNFSNEFYSGDNSQDILAAYAVVKSLCGIKEIERVKVTVNGENIKTSDGSIIDFLNDEDINLPTDTSNSEMRDVVVYFADKSNTTLIREIHSIKVTDRQPLEQYIINELIKGPNDMNSMNRILSPDTVVTSVETTGGICFVNFKSSFIDKNSSTENIEKLIIYSIVNSLTELENIQRVQFLFDGKKTEKFGSINVSDLFMRNKAFIAN